MFLVEFFVFDLNAQVRLLELDCVVDFLQPHFSAIVFVQSSKRSYASKLHGNL
jgi:hypothetical protein